jgi:hypothetical protein
VRVKIVARLEHDQLTPYGLVVHHHHPPTRIGKTTVAASVGSIFAQLRQDGRVVAIDADTAFGKLTARVVSIHAGNASAAAWRIGTVNFGAIPNDPEPKTR